MTTVSLFLIKLFFSIAFPIFLYKYTKKRLLLGEVRTEDDYRLYMSIITKTYNDAICGNYVKENKKKNQKKKQFFYSLAILLFIVMIHEEFSTSLPSSSSQQHQPTVIVDKDIVDYNWCLIAHPSDRSCVVNTSYWWRHTNAIIEQDRRYFIDEKEELLFTSLLRYPNLLYPFEPPLTNKVALLRETHLLTEVSNLARVNPLQCICGIFLGIIDNLIFLRQNEERRDWTILYDPYIYRNNSLAQYIESKADFPDKWQPYERKMKHYNQFLVAFRTINHRNNNHLFNQYNNNHKVIPLLRLEQNRTTEELIIQLDGINAICFIHCQRLSHANVGI